MKLKKDFMIAKEDIKIINNFIEIKFCVPNGYRLVKETLHRIVTKVANGYRQECFLFYKSNRYYIVHWSEMRYLDNNDLTHLNEEGLILRNKIAKLLVKYSLVKIMNEEFINVWIYEEDDKCNSIHINDDKFVRFDVLKHDKSKKININSMGW